MLKEIQVKLLVKPQSKSKYYSWEDNSWSSFMMAVMRNLEPRLYQKDELICHDMEEVDEILFVLTGTVSLLLLISYQYAIGYTVSYPKNDPTKGGKQNRQVTLALKMGPKTVIGDYALMFKQRSEFLYEALSDLNCMAIRKRNFQEVSEKYGFYIQKLKLKVFNRYTDIIRKPVLEHKLETIEQIQKINKLETGVFQVIDKTDDDERQLKYDMEQGVGEGQLHMKRIKKLEERVEQLGTIVNSLFIKYD